MNVLERTLVCTVRAVLAGGLLRFPGCGRVCRFLCLVGVAALLPFASLARAAEEERPAAVPLILDTDIGNDVDDVLALGMIHALESRRECKLLAVTISKDHENTAPFVDAVNEFYHRGDIPVGICGSGVTPDAGKFLELARVKDNDTARYPHSFPKGTAVPSALSVLRGTLAAAEDRSVVIVQIGFSTNLAELLQSLPDEMSPLSGKELVSRKVRLLSLMAGAFEKIPDQNGKVSEHRSYNIIKDITSAQLVASQWPTPMVWSGYELGIKVPYPHQSIENDFAYADHHPLSEAYYLFNPPPHDRPTWDLTSVLYAVRPNRGYFNVSEAGVVTVTHDGQTFFQVKKGGNQRYLTISPTQRARIIEALVNLSSQPPSCPPDDEKSQ